MSIRTVTHKAKVDLREKGEKRGKIVNYLELFGCMITQYGVSQIINIDEMATQIDMIENKLSTMSEPQVLMLLAQVMIKLG